MQDIQLFGELVRRELKLQGITQQEFAKIMKTSTPTIKRWLKGEGVLLKDWTRMLDCVGLSLSEALLILEGSSHKSFTYTEKQEQSLSTEEGLLAFFDLILKGRSPKQIARQYNLTEGSIVFYLSKLDKIGLIEWLPDNKVKLLVSGEPRWIKMGPLAQKFRKQIMEGYIGNYIDDRDQLKINIYSLSRESYHKIASLFNDLSEKIRSLEVRDIQDQDIKKLTTIILGYGNNDVPILTQIPNRGKLK
jgi:transcriptional regulator with XRE-family HTH domain